MPKRIFLIFTILLISAFAFAQQSATVRTSSDPASLPALPPGSGESPIPLLIRFSGNVGAMQGQPSATPITISFSLFSEETGGNPLWSENQSVSIDSKGRFTVLLGAATEGGLPPNIFVSGESRWIGVTLNDGTERPRAMLVSVPYAFEAGDAHTVNGHPSDDFVTQTQLDSYIHGVSQEPSIGSCVGGACGVASVPPAINAFGTLASADSSALQSATTNATTNNVGNGTGDRVIATHNSSGTAPAAPSAQRRFDKRMQTLYANNNVRTVQAWDNWSVSNIATPLTAGVQATITLPQCPRGIDASGSPLMGGPQGGYPILITDNVMQNNSETAYVTGGSCVPGNDGTLVFTPYFSHAASTYTVGSSSGGIQEAINDACGTSSVPWKNSNCTVALPDVGPQNAHATGIDVYDTIYFHANASLLFGKGTILNCHGRGPCLQVGDLNNANDYATDAIQGISFRTIDDRHTDPAFNGSLIQSTQRGGGTITIQTSAPHNLRTGDRVTQMLTDTVNYWGDVPYITVTDATHYTYTRADTPDIPLQVAPGLVALSYEAVLDNANSTDLVDLQYENTYEYGKFNHFFDFWDDESAQVEHFDNNAIGMNQSSTWTGSMVWSGGALNLPNKYQQLAPVITVNNASLTPNGSNCATILNSNGFYFLNSICQSQGPWEFLVTDATGNYQGADFENLYSEAGLGGNPYNPVKSPWPGLGVAGLIGGPISAAGSYTISGSGGFAGAMPTIGSGSTTYVYYAIARDLTIGSQTAPLPFTYEQENSPGQATLQWPRISAGTDTIVYDLIRNPAPNGTMGDAGGGYVAPYQGGCNGGNVVACGSIAVGLPQCSGLVCTYTDNTANPTSAYSIGNAYFAPNPTFWPGVGVLTNSPLMSVNEIPVTGIAFGGAPSEDATYCNDYGNNISGGYTVCQFSITSPNNSVPDQAPLILTDGPAAGGGGTPGAKGRLLFERTPTSELNFHQIITLYDSNPAKTQATTGHRPVGDPGDIYLGMDPNNNLSIGGGANGIAHYVNNIGDGNWLELLTGSLKTFKVPVNFTGGIELNGTYGAAGDCIMTTGSSVFWGSPGTNPSGQPQNTHLPALGLDNASLGKAAPDLGPSVTPTLAPSEDPLSPPEPVPMNSNVRLDSGSKSPGIANDKLTMTCEKTSSADLICHIVP